MSDNIYPMDVGKTFVESREERKEKSISKFFFITSYFLNTQSLSRAGT